MDLSPDLGCLVVAVFDMFAEFSELRVERVLNDEGRQG